VRKSLAFLKAKDLYFLATDPNSSIKKIKIMRGQCTFNEALTAAMMILLLPRLKMAFNLTTTIMINPLLERIPPPLVAHILEQQN
jgi:hypothetical protein